MKLKLLTLLPFLLAFFFIKNIVFAQKANSNKDYILFVFLRIQKTEGAYKIELEDTLIRKGKVKFQNPCKTQYPWKAYFLNKHGQIEDSLSFDNPLVKVYESADESGNLRLIEIPFDYTSFNFRLNYKHSISSVELRYWHSEHKSYSSLPVLPLSNRK